MVLYEYTNSIDIILLYMCTTVQNKTIIFCLTCQDGRKYLSLLFIIKCKFVLNTSYKLIINIYTYIISVIPNIV